jgi:hypothetical protein
MPQLCNARMVYVMLTSRNIPKKTDVFRGDRPTGGPPGFRNGMTLRKWMRDFLADEFVDPCGGVAAAEGTADSPEDAADCRAEDCSRSRLHCCSDGGSQRLADAAPHEGAEPIPCDIGTDPHPIARPGRSVENRRRATPLISGAGLRYGCDSLSCLAENPYISREKW